MKHTFKKSLSVILAAAIMLCSAPLTGLLDLDLPEFGGFQKFAYSVSDFFDGFAPKAEAAEYTSGNYIYGFNKNGDIVIRAANKSISGDVTLPSTLDGYNVVGITFNGFMDCDKITSITIPNNVTEIGVNAFMGCNGLATVILPNAISVIESGTFECCTNLSNIIIPDNVKTIGNSVFSACEKLTSVTIGNGVTSIGNWAFDDCCRLTDVYFNGTEEEWNKISIASYNDPLLNATIHFNSIGDDYSASGFCGDNLTWYFFDSTGELVISGAGKMYNYDRSSGSYSPWYTLRGNIKSVIIHDGVTYIGDEAFEASGLSDIIIPESVKGIGNSSFGSCYKLTNITIPNSVTDIGEGVFFGCKKLTTVTISDSIKCIEDNLFSNCTNLTNITIPDSVTYIGNNAFSVCVSLSSITIPDNVTSIGDRAFCYCTGLTSVIISDSVTSIGEDAFESCNSLTDVYYTGSNEEWNAISIGLINAPLFTSTIHYNYNSGGETLEPEGELKLISTTPSDNSTILITDNDLIFNFDKRVTSIKDGFEITISYDLNQKKITDENSNYKIEGSNLRIIDAFEGIPSQKQCYIKIKKFDAFDETKNVIYPFYGMASDEYIEVYLCDTIADSGYSQDHVIYDYSTRNEKYIDDKLDSLALPMDGTNGNPDFCVPGQGEDMIPQGLAYYEEKNWLLISSYNKVEKGDEDKQRNSVIFALDYDTGDFVAQFNLLHDDKSPFKGHVGGIAVSEHNLYISRGSGVAYIPLSELDVPEGAVKEMAIADKKNFAQLKKDDKADTESASCSYIDCTDGVLWAGNFYSFSGSVFNEGWRIPASENYNSVLLGFKLSGNSPEEEWKSINRKSADYYVGIPNSVNCIQGVAAKEIGNEKYQVFLSRTTGAAFTTTISAITFDFSRNKTAYPKKKNFVEINNLPGAENVVINDGGLYCVYESAALDEYGKLLWNENIKDTTDVVWRFDLSQILSIERYLQMFNCPINIEVYEKDSGKLVGRTVNNVVDEALEDKNVVVEVYGETKYLWTPANKEYTVKIIGNGEGKMDYSIIKYGSNLEETERTNFYDISITEGKEIVGELGAENFDVSQYKLTTGNETIYPSDSFMNSEHQVAVNVISDIDGAVTESIEAVAGDFVTVHASEVDGYIFAGWYIDNEAVGFEKEFGFVVKQDTNITAKYLKISIRKPSTTTINYGDSIILHADISGELPVGYCVEWTASNNNFKWTANGATCEISPEKSGDTTFTATIYDVEGNPVSTDEQTMTSKAGFFQKIIAFFKKLFGLTKTIPNVFKF